MVLMSCSVTSYSHSSAVTEPQNTTICPGQDYSSLPENKNQSALTPKDKRFQGSPRTLWLTHLQHQQFNINSCWTKKLLPRVCQMHISTKQQPVVRNAALITGLHSSFHRLVSILLAVIFISYYLHVLLPNYQQHEIRIQWGRTEHCLYAIQTNKSTVNCLRGGDDNFSNFKRTQNKAQMSALLH